MTMPDNTQPQDAREGEVAYGRWHDLAIGTCRCADGKHADGEDNWITWPAVTLNAQAATITRLTREVEGLRAVLEYLSIEPDELGTLWSNQLGRYAYPHEIAAVTLTNPTNEEEGA